MPGIPLEKLRGQLQKIKHLVQPFFLPTDQASGWTFLWLIASLLFCVNGITFALLTAALKGLEQLDPSRASKYLGGVEGFVHTIWHSWWGAIFAGLFAIGLISFEFTGVDVSFSVPESSLTFGFIISPFSFINRSVDPFLYTVALPLFKSTAILFYEHLPFIHGAVREHIIVNENDARNIILKFWQ